jgi:hypothetical protein
MPAVGSESERFAPQHCGKIEWRIKMREQRTASRSLPFQGRPKPSRIERDDNQPLLPGEMRGERPRELMAGREMDEAVASIVGGAVEAPRDPRLFESRLRTL